MYGSIIHCHMLHRYVYIHNISYIGIRRYQFLFSFPFVSYIPIIFMIYYQFINTLVDFVIFEVEWSLLQTQLSFNCWYCFKVLEEYFMYIKIGASRIIGICGVLSTLIINYILQHSRIKSSSSFGCRSIYQPNQRRSICQPNLTT